MVRKEEDEEEEEGLIVKTSIFFFHKNIFALPYFLCYLRDKKMSYSVQMQFFVHFNYTL